MLCCSLMPVTWRPRSRSATPVAVGLTPSMTPVISAPLRSVAVYLYFGILLASQLA